MCTDTRGIWQALKASVPHNPAALRQVRIHFIIVMIRWTGLAPWEFECPFSGSLTSTFLVGAGARDVRGGDLGRVALHYRSGFTLQEWLYITGVALHYRRVARNLLSLRCWGKGRSGK